MCLHDKNHIVSLLLSSNHEGKLPKYPKHYGFHHNNNEQGLKVSLLQVKEEKIGWNEGRQRFQLIAAHVELRFLEYLYVGHEWCSVGYF